MLREAARRYERVIRFLIAGGLATFVYSALTIALVQSRTLRDPATASALSSFVAIPISFVAQRLITFRDVDYEPRQWTRYIVLAASNLVVNVGLIRLGQTAAIPYPVMIAAGWVVVPGVNFLVNTLWVFRARTITGMSREG